MSMKRRMALTLAAVLLGGCGAMDAHHGASGNQALSTHGLIALNNTYASADTMNRLGDNDPKWLIHRHGACDCSPAEQVGKTLAAIASDTVAK